MPKESDLYWENQNRILKDKARRAMNDTLHKKKIGRGMKATLAKQYKKPAPKKKISAGIAAKIKTLEAAQSKAQNCMKYINKKASQIYKNSGTTEKKRLKELLAESVEERKKLKKIWAESMKKAYSDAKSDRASGKIKCHMGRQKK